MAQKLMLKICAFNTSEHADASSCCHGFAMRAKVPLLLWVNIFFLVGPRGYTMQHVQLV